MKLFKTSSKVNQLKNIMEKNVIKPILMTKIIF